MWLPPSLVGGGGPPSERVGVASAAGLVVGTDGQQRPSAAGSDARSSEV